MRVLVTGDRGFVGTETVKLLFSKGIEVIGYDLMDNRDIRDLAQLETRISVERPNRILHLAAVARFADADKDPKMAFDINVKGTQNIAYVAQKYHIPVVYASTGSVYMPITQEPPITEDFSVKGNSVYGCTKAMGEYVLKEMSTPWIFLRYAHLYGKEKRMHGLIGGFVDRIKRGLAPVLYGGKQSNDFTYIKDVAMANHLALIAPWDKWFQAYNIGTGEELTAEKAGQIICKYTGWKGKIEKKEMRTVDPIRFNFSIDKAKTMLGFEPEYDFEKGLKEMFDEPKPTKQNTV